MKNLLARYHRLFLVLILAFAFLTRIYQLHVPERYVFDEVYHAVTAKLIARNDPWAYEWWNPPIEADTAVDWLHPPLAKYTQAISISIFGENSFGWRFSSVIFGVLVVLATYKLALTLFNKPSLALLAAGLASLDGLLLVQSRIAMNDIHVTFFILLTLNFGIKYLRAKMAWLTSKKSPAGLKPVVIWSLATGVSAGLAMGSKWSGAFVLGGILLCEAATWLWTWFKLKRWRRDHWNLLALNALALVILPFALYVLSYVHMFSTGHSLLCHQEQQIEKECYYEEFKIGDRVVFQGYVSHFVELHRQIWLYQTGLTATHPYQSRPWQWFLNLRPVWYHVDYIDDATVANIYNLGNPLLFWIGDVAILTTLVYLLATWYRTKKLPNTVLLFLIFSYLIVWLPWARSPRIMFFYHYTPAVPLLVINLAYWLQRLWDQKRNVQRNQILVALCVGVILATFIVWYPLWTGIPMATNWSNQVYFSLPAWK